MASWLLRKHIGTLASHPLLHAVLKYNPNGCLERWSSGLKSNISPTDRGKFKQTRPMVLSFSLRVSRTHASPGSVAVPSKGGREH